MPTASVPKQIFVPPPVPVTAAPVPVIVAPPAALPPPPVDAAAFSFGTNFQTLQPALGALLGDPLEDVLADPSGCPAQQTTSTGLLYDDCDTGLVAFVATDGVQHWGILNGRLLQWTDASADPPPNAIDVAASQAILPTPCGDTLEPESDSPCLLADSAPQPGILSTSGETTGYAYNAFHLSNDLVVSLSQLPADYDLYLADADGNILGSSVLDGIADRFLEVTVGAGTYYVYVHVDPSRTPDPSTPYVLQANLQQ
ncbi:MAG: hypothetical protein JO057_26480 [Chloroflexi bacterium]|nr:hypothetical protein [Chloroflexota bacterium]